MPTRHRTCKRFLTLALLLLVVAPSLIGCVRVRASITVSPDDRVSGQIVAAAIARDADDKGPQLLNNLPFAQKVAVSEYSRDDYVGSQAVFSNLTFAELPQLANMNRDAAGVDISLRRAGDRVILEGRVDLTSLNDAAAEVSLSVSFPGEVTSTNGDQISTDVVEWKLRPGVVSTMNAQARYTDPSARSFTGAAIWLAVASFVVAGIIGALAYTNRDRSPRVGELRDQQQ
ncbi:MAG: DUF3153 domain-containing protein [Actinomycetia bacterium]|nr:DUF3153 domain-containing protein [Actinomycetes bacterium]MCH9701446.1 DUF3153 domain-containing protein [Actinomycetes bacterium]MCH9759275.1 DUF3153 domain-containing protein [Actinomycetes bacterium]